MKKLKVYSSQFNYQYGKSIHFPYSIASLFAYIKSFPDLDKQLQFEKTFIFRNKLDEYVDIMLAHSPPYGVNDDINDNTHTGLIGLKRYIEAKCPKFFLHGHTYPSDPNKIVELGDTKIIYVYQDKVINL